MYDHDLRFRKSSTKMGAMEATTLMTETAAELAVAVYVGRQLPRRFTTADGYTVALADDNGWVYLTGPAGNDLGRHTTMGEALQAAARVPAPAPITEPFYAMSPHRTGVFWFPTMDEANDWVSKHDGERLGPKQVDPVVRRLCTATHLHRLHQLDHGVPADDLTLWDDLTEQAQGEYLRRAKQVVR